jgi:peptide deformylase
MDFKPLPQNDPRLREHCINLTKRELMSAVQQHEISQLLEFVQGRSTAHSRGANARVQPGTVGLSMNQVGVMKSICIVDLSIGRRGYTDLHVLVNPRILWQSKTSLQRVEGCVNFTTIWGKTRRSKAIKVAALDRSGNELMLAVSGWPAILLQHEIDHLHGRLFVDRLVDPSRADLVKPSEFANYKKDKESWTKSIDVTDIIVEDTTSIL